MSGQPLAPFYSFISTSANVCLVAPGAGTRFFFFYGGEGRRCRPLLPNSIPICHVVGNITENKRNESVFVLCLVF